MKEKGKICLKNREYMTRLIDVVLTLTKGGKFYEDMTKRRAVLKKAC